MSNLNHLSPQEQACIAEVQKAPEAQRQSVFERACQIIKNQTQIATLALTLWLSQPALAQKAPETNQNYQTFHAQMVEKHPNLSLEQQQFFTTLYVKWLSVIDPKNEKIFWANIRRIAYAQEGQKLAIHIVNSMIEKKILPENHSYTKILVEITQEIDKIGQQKIAILDQRIQQADQRIQQADQRIKQYERLTEMLKTFQN